MRAFSKILFLVVVASSAVALADTDHKNCSIGEVSSLGQYQAVSVTCDDLKVQAMDICPGSENAINPVLTIARLTKSKAQSLTVRINTWVDDVGPKANSCISGGRI